MSIFVAPYKAGSKSAKRLAEGLDAKRIKKTRSNFVGDSLKTVINWGNSNLSEEALKCRVINHPDAVKIASNKRSFFEHIQEKIYQTGLLVNLPDFTTSKRVAEDWLDYGHTVVERHKLTGNSGDGIKLKSEGDAIEEARLYVRYIPKKSEWRVHVVGDEAILVQRKARKRDVPDSEVNWKVRNHDNGFIFARNEGEAPPSNIIEQAVAVVKACGLDFGAVDLIYNERANIAYVLEVNTACGMEGSTLDDYVEAFKRLLSESEEVEQPTPAQPCFAQSAPRPFPWEGVRIE